MLNIYKIIIFLLVLVFFNACDTQDSNYSYNSSEYPQAGKLNGILVDGYIKDATVCIDVDKNEQCDASKYTDKTSDKGLFQVDKPSTNSQVMIYLLTSNNGTDTSTDKPFNEHFINILASDELDQNKTYVVSPLTDLITYQYTYILEDANSSADLYEAKGDVSSLFDIGRNQLELDPMKNKDIFSISQQLQHTKMFIKTLIVKHLKNSLDENAEKELLKKIKISYLQEYGNIRDIISSLELQYSLLDMEINIPENEINFVIKQLQELENTLKTLIQDSALTIENLGRLQKLIDIELQEAYDLLQYNTDTESDLGFIDLDITISHITKTLFNTVGALLDENACTEINGYNKLSNSKYAWPTFTGEPTVDIENGISLKATGSDANLVNAYEVSVFYPNLEPPLENSTVPNSIAKLERDLGYSFAFDSAWTSNENNMIYIMTPKDVETGLYDCYRYELNSDNINNINPTKVFKYNELYKE